MLKYIQRLQTDEFALYDYTFEDNDAPGTIEINLTTGLPSVKKLASNDQFCQAAAHLMRELFRQFKSRSLKKTGIVAWY